MNTDLPFSKAELDAMIEKYGTPFYVYDEQAIRTNVRDFYDAFSIFPDFKEYFAVKATPNPSILEILREEGCGADTSSLPELILSEKAGITGENIYLTSNDTPDIEFQKAMELGAVLNLDDITHIECVEKACGKLPELISFRYNPGPRRTGNAIIGNPVEAKYGLTYEQIFEAYEICKKKGVKRFSIHTMVASNELNSEYIVETARMMFGLAGELKEKLDIDLDTINLGGGIGIPYRPEEEPMDLHKLACDIKALYDEMIVAKGLKQSRLAFESGRMIMGPYGYLVTTAIHEKHIYKEYIGLNACMADLMRPGIYGAYHHITVVGKENEPHDHVYDVTGSLCENNDKFAVDRHLPKIDIGDTLVIHCGGAHAYSMGFNYNGKLRPAEVLWHGGMESKLIRRRETLDDYFATLNF